MDVNSVFLNGFLKDEVYVKKPPGFENEKFPNYVFKLRKALYGLRQLVLGMKSLVIFNQEWFYLRFPSKPKESHLNVVKRIFKYLSGTITLGLFYPITNAFDLVVYSDADYAGCQSYRKSTSGVGAYLGQSLVSWLSKKQTYVG
ncbi:secreted RxLR effector protein 161-like [Apium graveolens]|uniref:secreted RxLR effector protein 161-like n=1 Tax=Apium graveolens TaxID=4045 RepID=UPI003D7AF904